MPVVSVTRFELRAWWHLPAFHWAVLRAYRQAARADGMMGQRLARLGRGSYWTATLWRDEAALLAYRDSGAHRDAMRRTARWAREMASARAEGDALPTWDEARALMARGGRVRRYARE